MPPVTNPLEKYSAAGPMRRRQAGWARHALALSALSVLVVGILLYRHWTEPQRVLATARGYLETLTGGQVEIEDASFSFWHGVRISGVEVTLPDRVAFFKPNDRLASSGGLEREIFRAGEIRLRPDLLAMIFGRVAVKEILASDAVFTLIRRMDDGRHNWQALLESRPETALLGDITLPKIRLRDATIRLQKLSERGLTDLDTIRLTVSASPAGHSNRSYRVLWQQRGEHSRQGDLRIDLDPPGVEAESGGLPSLNIDAVLAAMPGNVEVFSDWLALLGLRGRVGIEALSLVPSEQSESTVRVESVAFSVPWDEAERNAPPETRMFRLEDVEGELRWSGTRVEAELTGYLNGNQCQVSGILYVPEGKQVTWADVGFELEVSVDRFELPVLSPDPDGRNARFVQRFAMLRYLYDRYDPHGAFRIELSVRRDPLTDDGVQVTRCAAYPLGGDAAYFKYPLRLTDVTGVIEYTPEGVQVDVQGAYGGGQITVHCTSPRISPHTGLDLTIEGINIPLDEEMYAALRQHHQDLWRRFSPNGWVNVLLKVHREDEPEPSTAPFENEVDVEFLGVDGAFASFPYPFENLSGCISVVRGETEVHRITGQRGEARLTVTGTSRKIDSKRQEMDLELVVSDLVVDPELIGCFPAETRETVKRFALTGSVDLSGTITREPDADHVDFDLRGALKNGSTCHERVPIRLSDVRGDFRIRPAFVTLENWRGRSASIGVQADGTFQMREDASTIHKPWRIRCSNVECAGEVRESLPEELLELWERFGVTGPIDIDLEYTKGAAGEEDDYRATLTAHDNTVRAADFPWTLEGVSGQVVVTPGSVEFQGLHGRHGESEVALHGWYDRGKATAMVSLHATNVALDEELRKAVPWRIRRNWNVLQPAGTVDLHLTRLTKEVDSDGVSLWRYEGSAAFHDFSLKGGIPIQEVEGEIRGSGALMSQGRWQLNGEMKLDSCRVKNHLFEDVEGVVTRTMDPNVLSFSDVQASIHQGQAVGRVIVQLGDDGGYEFSMLAQDMALGPFLEALSGSAATSRPMYGRVQFRMFYDAEFDHAGEARGGGEIRISGGALFKVPLMLSVLRVLEPIPATDDLQDAEITFFIDRREVNMQSIAIRDRFLVLTGTGTMSMGGSNVNVVLLAGAPPERSSPLTALQEFVQGALQELVEVRIVGDLDNPSIKTRPLRGIDEALRIMTESRKDFSRWTR